MPCVISRGRLRGGEAAGFVQPAPLLGCSEKSPRQARAGITTRLITLRRKAIGPMVR
jgi:hypothetical protein